MKKDKDYSTIEIRSGRRKIKGGVVAKEYISFKLKLINRKT